MEELIPCQYGLVNKFCNEGNCEHYDKILFCQKLFSVCDTCGNNCKSKQLADSDPECWVRACNCGSGQRADLCNMNSKWCG